MSDLIDRARAALDGVTPGPWLYRPLPYDDWGWVKADDFVLCQARDPNAIDCTTLAEHRVNGTDPWRANGQFIAAARSLVPEMADEIARLRAEVERLREAERTAWERGRNAAAAFVGKCDWESYWILDNQLVEPLELVEAIRALTPEAPQ